MRWFSPSGSGSPQWEDLAVAVAAGLCAECAWTRRIASGRGPVYYWCGKSKEDGRYPKYPHLPVLRCAGYIPLDDNRPNEQ